MREKKQYLHLLSFSFIKPRWVLLLAPLLVIALSLSSSKAFAQGGSAAGTIGRQDKSSYGVQEHIQEHDVAPRVERRTPAKHMRGAPPRLEAGSLAAYDGTWVGISTGTCIGSGGWVIQISNGILSGNGAHGRVVRGGSVSGAMDLLGTSYFFQGRLTPTGGFGTWKTVTGCAGKWSTSKS